MSIAFSVGSAIWIGSIKSEQSSAPGEDLEEMPTASKAHDLSHQAKMRSG